MLLSGLTVSSRRYTWRWYLCRLTAPRVTRDQGSERFKGEDASANTRHLRPRWGSSHSLSATCVVRCQLSGPCQKETAVGEYFAATGWRSERGWRGVRQQSESSTRLRLDASMNHALNPRQRSITSVIIGRTQVTKRHGFSILLCLPKTDQG